MKKKKKNALMMTQVKFASLTIFLKTMDDQSNFTFENFSQNLPGANLVKLFRSVIYSFSQ